MHQVEEFLLQGSVLDAGKDLLLQRLRGLTDSKFEEFYEHELVFVLRMPSPGANTFLHARRSLDVASPWHLRYISKHDAESNRICLTTMRKSVDTLCHSQDLMSLLRMDYEFVAKGCVFSKGKLKITVSKVFKVLQAGNVRDIEALSNSHLVELSALAPQGLGVAASEIKAFAEQLKPLSLLPC